jgi:integrase
MAKRTLALGERGEVAVTVQKRDEHGKWKKHGGAARSAERWQARCYFRGHDGVVRELARFAPRKADALSALEAAWTAAEHRGSGHVEMTASTPLVKAGEIWLEQIARPDSRLAARTVADYERTYRRYVDREGSAVRGLTLAQANSPQRLSTFLQGVADSHGTGAARSTRSALMGILSLAVDNGVLPSNGLRQVRAPQARQEKATERDTTRALTKAERDSVIAYADALAAEAKQAPQTRRKRQATADLVAFMAGTGVRIAEARALRWEDVHLSRGSADVRGTKSKAAERRLTLPPWLVERLSRRAQETGETGYVFGSPHHVESQGEREWDQSNCAKALAKVLDGAGFGWATPHTFRRTVATILHEVGTPLAQIADHLGHADPSMTARVYLGRDPFGDRPSVAQHL